MTADMTNIKRTKTPLYSLAGGTKILAVAPMMDRTD